MSSIIDNKNDIFPTRKISVVAGEVDVINSKYIFVNS